ncbi:MAG TPA: hypothetical protein VFJ93_10585 [Gaiellaceae bacterium]|nr:hypothetical protein [Gaiellaceae bacterium]
MRRAALISLTAVLAAGCGSARPVATTTATPTPKAAPAGLRVGVVGPLAIDVRGARVERGPLDEVGDAPLVLVSARSASVEKVTAAAEATPGSHFAYVGGSAKAAKQPNLVGLVLRDDQAAKLGGVVAGFVAREQGGTAARVAWVGPEERALSDAFALGVHESLPPATILYAFSKRIPARCKEAALGAIARGAVVVMAHGGACASAAADGAHQQNHVALSLGDFELPSVAATVVVRDAVSGVFHGGEDLVFGAASGAIGVRRLDPLVSPATAAAARASAEQLGSALRGTG